MVKLSKARWVGRIGCAGTLATKMSRLVLSCFLFLIVSGNCETKPILEIRSHADVALLSNGYPKLPERVLPIHFSTSLVKDNHEFSSYRIKFESDFNTCVEYFIAFSKVSKKIEKEIWEQVTKNQRINMHEDITGEHPTMWFKMEKVKGGKFLVSIGL